MSVRLDRPSPAGHYADQVITNRRLWWALGIMTAAAVTGPVVTVALMVPRQQIARQAAILDGSENLIVARFADPVTSKEMQDTLSLLAGQSLLNRNPAGFENEEILKRLFLPAALAKVRKEFADLAKQYRAGQVVQSVRIGRIVAKVLDDNHVDTKVIGQIDLNGVENGEEKHQVQDVTVVFNFARNPNLGAVKMYSLAVRDYHYINPPERLPEQTASAPSPR